MKKSRIILLIIFIISIGLIYFTLHIPSNILENFINIGNFFIMFGWLLIPEVLKNL